MPRNTKFYKIKTDTASWGGVPFRTGQIVRSTGTYSYFVIVLVDNTYTALLYREDVELVKANDAR